LKKEALMPGSWLQPDCTPACDEEAGGNKDAVVAVPVHADVLAIAASEGIGSSSRFLWLYLKPLNTENELTMGQVTLVSRGR
jgi:hypothetical protein